MAESERCRVTLKRLKDTHEMATLLLEDPLRLVKDGESFLVTLKKNEQKWFLSDLIRKKQKCDALLSATYLHARKKKTLSTPAWHGNRHKRFEEVNG